MGTTSFADVTKFTADGSKNFSPTRPKLLADTSKLPADASKVSHRRDYFILDASASRVGYAADVTRNH